MSNSIKGTMTDLSQMTATIKQPQIELKVVQQDVAKQQTPENKRAVADAELFAAMQRYVQKFPDANVQKFKDAMIMSTGLDDSQRADLDKMIGDMIMDEAGSKGANFNNGTSIKEVIETSLAADPMRKLDQKGLGLAAAPDPNDTPSELSNEKSTPPDPEKFKAIAEAMVKQI